MSNITYLKEFKILVEKEKEQEIEDMKQFMVDFCLPQFKCVSSINNAIVSCEDLISQGISISNFKEWLSIEGFSVVMVGKSNSSLNISY